MTDRPTFDPPPTIVRAIERFATRYELTDRESAVLHLIFRGLKNESISEQLKISRPTVRFHTRNLHYKTNTSDIVDLVLKLWYEYSDHTPNSQGPN